MAFLLALLAPIMSAWAHGGAHYGKMSVEASGSGTVYLSTQSSGAASGDTDNPYTWDCGNSDDGLHNEIRYCYAVPDPGYKFTGWTGDKVTDSNKLANPFKLELKADGSQTSPTTATLTAKFEERTDLSYQVKFLPAENGTYTAIDANKTDWAGKTTPTQNRLLKVTLSAQPAENFLLAGFYTTTDDGANKTYLTSPEVTLVENISVGVDFIPDGVAIYAAKAKKGYDDLATALLNAGAGESIAIYSDVSLETDAAVGLGVSLTVFKGATLTVSSDSVLYIDGTLSVKGSIDGTVSKCATLIQQKGNGKTDDDGNPTPITPYTGSPAIKYWKTETIANPAIISGLSSCPEHLSVYNGYHTNVYRGKSKPVLQFKRASSIAVNHIVVDKDYPVLSDSMDTLLKAKQGTIPDGELALITVDGQVMKEFLKKSGNYTKTYVGGVIDCAGHDLQSSSSYEIADNGGTKILNCKYIHLPDPINLKYEFYNCKNIELNAYNIGNGSTLSMYDCGPIFKITSYDGTDSGSKTEYRFYSGVYDIVTDSRNHCVLYGGLYLENPSADKKYTLASGKNLVVTPTADGYYKVEVSVPASYIAQIVSSSSVTNKYTSLQKAFDEVGEGQTVSLLQNCGSNEVVNVSVGKNFIFDLAGYSITNSLGTINNNGTIWLMDSSGKTGVNKYSIVNYGVITNTYGTYSSSITLKPSSRFVVHNGHFDGDIVLDSTINDAHSVLELRGGWYSQNLENAGYLANGVVQSNKWVGVPPFAVKEECVISGTTLDKAWMVSAFSQKDKAIWDVKNSAYSAFSNFEDKDCSWNRYAELQSIFGQYQSDIIDAVICCDRYTAAKSIHLYVDADGGIRKVDSDTDANLIANEPYRVLSSKLQSFSNVSQISYLKYLNGDEDINSYIPVGIKNNTGNVGTVTTLEMQLCTQGKDGAINKKLSLAVCRYMLGGKKAAVDRNDVRTAYDSLADAVDAENLQNGDWVLVGANSTEKITIAKAGTFTIDPYGFNYDTANVSIGEAYFAKSTTEGTSRAAAQKVESAKAVTYEVARKVAGVGGQFYDNLAEAVAAANGAAVTLYAETDETITLTAEGQSFTLNKNGIAFDDAKVVTTIANGSVTKSVTDAGTVYTAVTSVVEASDGNKYASVGAAVATAEGNDVSVTVTANVSENVTLPQGKALTVTVADGVTANVKVTSAEGAFIVESDVEGGKKYEAKRITETYSGEEVALSGNGAIVRADNAEAAELKEISVTLVSTETTGGAIRKATFEVTPKDANGEAMGGTLDRSYVFRLPVDANATQQAAVVYHGEAQFGVYGVQTWEGAKFIEVESSSFSPYAYELLDGETANPVAAIGTTGYATLAAAIAAAQAGDTVTMLDNVTLTEPLNVMLGDKAVTLDLGGKTLAGRTNLKSGNLTVRNGTVAGGSAQALNVYGSADTTATNYSVLTIASDATVTADVYGVCIFGETAGSNGYGAVVNIAGTVATTGDGRNGAVFVSGNLGKNVSGDMHNIVNVTGSVTSATDAAIAMNGSATVNVSDGATVTGNTAIAVKRGVLNVTGGTIRATGAKNYEAAAYANGTEMTGAAISLSDTYSQYGAMSVNISGGTVKSDNADALFKKDGDYQADATIAVSAGGFSSAVAEEYCAANYIPGEIDPDTGLYTVVTGTYVAQIVRGGSVVKKYTTLSGAIGASEIGDTVQLLANVTENVTVNKAITIDGQTYTLTGDGNSTVLTVDGGVTVEVKNIVIDGAALFNYLDGTVKVTGYSTLALGEGVSIKNGIYCNLYLDRGSVTGSQGVTMVGGEAVVNAEGKAMYGEKDITVAVQALSSMLNGGSSLEPGTTIGLPYFDIVRQRPDGDIVNIADGEGRVKQGASLLFLANGDFSDAGQGTVTLPTRFYSYTLNIANFVGATGWTEGEWNDIIDTGCATIDLIAGTGQGDKPMSETVDVTLRLNEDVAIPGEDGFEYRNSNFTIDGNNKAISGTIVYTDNAGTMENVVMGTEEEPLVLDMTGLSAGNSINLGSGIAATNVTIKITEEQADTQGQTIVTWNTEGETAEESAAMEAGIKVEIVNEEGETIVDEETGKPQEASLVWDAEVGRAYIGPCEARLTTVDANNETVYIYTSLARAIELARNSGDTVTLMMDIENFTGTQEIYKNLVLDGAGHKIAAKPVTTHRNVVSAFIGGTAMLKIEGHVTVRNITIDGDVSHAYTYLISADNGNAALTTENITLLHGGELCGDDNGNVLRAGAGYGAAIHLNNGAKLTVKDGFYADTHGAPAEAGQTIAKADGIFPFTAILPERLENGTAVSFELTEDTDAKPTVAIGEDLLLVGMVGAIDSDTAQGILDYMQVPSRFRPYTLTLGDGSAYAFTGASLLGWNEIIDYGKEIMDVSTAVGYEGLDKDETPVEVGLLTDTVLPETFTYEDSNFTVNGNGNALSGTIKYTDEAGIIENIVLGTEEAPLVLDLRNVTDPVEIGNLISVSNVTVLMTEEQATLGQPVFTWNTETAQEPENSDLVVITVLESAGTPYDPEEETITKGLVWDDELGIAYIGPCEARLTGPEREPGYMDLTNAFNMAVGGDTVTLFWSGVTLNEEIGLPAGTLLFATNKYELALGENAAFVFTNATSVFRSEMAFSTDIMALAGDVASGYLLRTATDGTTNVYSVVRRGEYNVTGKTEDGDVGTAVIKVADSWVEEHVGANVKTANQVETFLNSTNSVTNMREWEMYVLNQTVPFRVTAVGKADNSVSTTLGAPEAEDVTGFTVVYSLDRVAADGTLVAEGARAAYENIAFAVPVTSVEGHAFYRVRAHLTSGESTLVVDSANTIGVLKATATTAQTIVAVPWAAFGGGDIAVADLLRTDGLSADDELFVYNPSTQNFRAWTLGSGKTWEPTTVIAAGTNATPGEDAASVTVSRGSGVLLKRVSVPATLCFVGEVVSGGKSALSAAATSRKDGGQSWNLVASPSVEALDINDNKKFPAPSDDGCDRIVVLTSGAPLNFTYKDGKWGYVKVVVDEKSRGVPTRVTENVSIPAGIGFWYLNSGAAREIKW